MTFVNTAVYHLGWYKPSFPRLTIGQIRGFISFYLRAPCSIQNRTIPYYLYLCPTKAAKLLFEHIRFPLFFLSLSHLHCLNQSHTRTHPFTLSLSPFLSFLTVFQSTRPTHSHKFISQTHFFFLILLPPPQKHSKSVLRSKKLKPISLFCIEDQFSV